MFLPGCNGVDTHSRQARPFTEGSVADFAASANFGERVGWGGGGGGGGGGVGAVFMKL